MRVVVRGTAGLVMLVSLLALIVPSYAGGDDKNQAIKELMVKSHRGENAPLSRLAKQVKAENPDWQSVKDNVAKLREMSTALAKFKKNSAGQKDYAKGVDGLMAAMEKKDREALTVAHRMLMQSCSGCHYVGLLDLKD
jgi:cytochrome c556